MIVHFARHGFDRLLQVHIAVVLIAWVHADLVVAGNHRRRTRPIVSPDDLDEAVIAGGAGGQSIVHALGGTSSE